jgi:hypothetical protein
MQWCAPPFCESFKSRLRATDGPALQLTAKYILKPTKDVAGDTPEQITAGTLLDAEFQWEIAS